ncbi:MAG: hypothetical protein EMLJLAPB_01118 [Candidatus Argoarchaeum ethanivorans]|uniref:Uncharacterized protein n=1 Tax=Candidatus Argoarchaeum ethanivorans TaxID=2608793 RepID=A0A811TEY6_9EURY|nr:MAG: hypothetical protein EMLJLAPB_01118 [Candidatus Argoarchaeum ethanivorans]
MQTGTTCLFDVIQLRHEYELQEAINKIIELH